MKQYSQLSQEERCLIAYFLRRHLTHSDIARELGRHRCTIGREIQRNKRAYDGGYRAEQAQSYYQGRRRRSRYGFHHTKTQRQPVFYLIRKKWSPEEIAYAVKTTSIFGLDH